MNYKKIFRNRRIRIKIIQWLGFLPDKLMVRIQYRIKMNRKLNLNNPKRYTEKLQWYKLYYRNPLMPICADKYLVRNYVKDVGLEFILNDLYGVYTDPNSIDFSTLPYRFVVKDTLGGGGNTVFICDNKENLNVNKFIQTLDKWLRQNNKKNPGCEWVYEKGTNRIIIEKYLEETDKEGGLTDYKFFCFNGEVEFIYYMNKRRLGKSVSVSLLNRDFNLMNVKRIGDNAVQGKIIKPKNYGKMIEYAELLSKPFPHARIDLYNIEGKIIFGEITFFNASGYMKYDPDVFDYIIGEKFHIC